MQHNILWTGIEYYSLENCLVQSSPSGVKIQSTIIGLYEDEIYHAEYTLHTNSQWLTTMASIVCRHADVIQTLQLHRNPDGNWQLNGNEIPALNDCMDIDIPITPFTNSLPINRLGLNMGETKEISVVYLDLLAESMRPVRQQYSRKSEFIYHYENVPNDFEADVEVDDHGFVITYPGLFSRKAIQTSKYP